MAACVKSVALAQSFEGQDLRGVDAGSRRMCLPYISSSTMEPDPPSFDCHDKSACAVLDTHVQDFDQPDSRGVDARPRKVSHPYINGTDEPDSPAFDSADTVKSMIVNAKPETHAQIFNGLPREVSHPCTSGTDEPDCRGVDVPPRKVSHPRTSGTDEPDSPWFDSVESTEDMTMHAPVFDEPDCRGVDSRPRKVSHPHVSVTDGHDSPAFDSHDCADVNSGVDSETHAQSFDEPDCRSFDAGPQSVSQNDVTWDAYEPDTTVDSGFEPDLDDVDGHCDSGDSTPSPVRRSMQLLALGRSDDSHSDSGQGTPSPVSSTQPFATDENEAHIGITDQQGTDTNQHKMRGTSVKVLHKMKNKFFANEKEGIGHGTQSNEKKKQQRKECPISSIFYVDLDEVSHNEGPVP